ncbi:MAG: phenylalanine--tRNA ligase subunit alpha [Candidatus Methylacidiphilales bacterium]|nr:phenylalanine--tRNA ligase subunit alpha [Candidatus Methylacidiphilales bacterium]
MQAEYSNLLTEALAAVEAAADAAALEAVRVQFLGRNGSITALMEQMKDLPKDQRPIIGRLVNEGKGKLAAAFEDRKNAFADASAGSGPKADTSLPGRTEPYGSLHPVLQVRDRIVDIFRRMGFALADGPDIEFEFYNFDALNTPPDHPARNEQDTFFIRGEAPGDHGKGKLLLRSHTSPVQARTMEKQQPPLRIIAPGRCYRRDEIDATHLMSFMQMEGLAVDKDLSLAHLKGTLEFFFRELLGRDLVFRFRPHFFPFTEPSFEVDCSRPGTLIKGKEWLEICGCGMVDPNVLRSVGYDPEVCSGWAFGFGLERVAMLLHEVPDLRYFTEGDTRFLKQFTRTLV